MKMKGSIGRLWLVSWLLCGLAPQSSRSQTPALNSSWFYTLIDGSQLIDDCPVCDRLTAPVPLQGTFQLRFLGQGPLFSTYAIENLSMSAGSAGGRTYKLEGRGTYRIGGEVGLQQDLSLEVTIDDGFTNQLCEFTNATPQVARRWPMFSAESVQTNGTLTRQYSLTFYAAPFRELWFSTVAGFRASIWNSPTDSVSGGDLLSSAGRIVKRNNQLTGHLGVQPPVPDLGLKDIDILPGGEIAFSIEQDTFSETIGQLLSQDVLSDQGRILRHLNPDLIKNFLPTPPVPQVIGLDALQFRDDGRVYFSVQTAFNSTKLSTTLGPGDLLSDDGTIVASAAQLLSAFTPTSSVKDVGLDAVFVWPSGEIWFSTRSGFTNSTGLSYAAGDLLSDQGYLVYSNQDLLRAFAPSTAADLGLDALYAVSDVATVAQSPLLQVPSLPTPPTGDMVLLRSKGAHVFQLEMSSNPTGPWTAAGPITTDTLFVDPGAITNQSQRFYRLRQW